MVVFNNSSNYKPQTFIDRLKRFAETKYTTSQIYQDHPTIVLKLNHIRFELVSEYKGSWFDSSCYIPGPSSGFRDWVTMNPNGLNDQLTRANQSYDNKIKPMIRLVKYWNALNGYVYDTFTLKKTWLLTHTGFVIL